MWFKAAVVVVAECGTYFRIKMLHNLVKFNQLIRAVVFVIAKYGTYFEIKMLHILAKGKPQN